MFSNPERDFQRLIGEYDSNVRKSIVELREELDRRTENSTSQLQLQARTGLHSTFADAQSRLSAQMTERAQQILAEASNLVETRIAAERSAQRLALADAIAEITFKIESRAQLAVAEATAVLEGRIAYEYSVNRANSSQVTGKLYSQIETRAQLASAEAMAYAKDRVAHELASIHAAVKQSISTLQERIDALQLEVSDVRTAQLQRRVEAEQPRTVAPYIAHAGVTLSESNWSAPLTWQFAFNDAAIEHIKRALGELGHKVSEIDSPETEVLWSSMPAPFSSSSLVNLTDGEAGRSLLVDFEWPDNGLPFEAVEWLNAHVDGIACRSSRARKALLDHGCTIPAAVVGIGFDDWEQVVSDASYRASGRSFRFLYVSDGGADLDFDAALESFERVFVADDDVSLIIKPTGPAAVNLIARIQERRASNASYPDVVVLPDGMTHAQLKALYAQCHVFVSTNRTQLLDASIPRAFLSGIPVIAPRWGGHMDYCTPQNSWLLDYTFVRGISPIGLLATVCARSNQSALDQALWFSYRATQAERFTMAWNGRKKILDMYNWKGAGLRLATLGSEVCAAPNTASTIGTLGVISSWNSKCGIAAYMKHALAAFQRTDYVVFADKNSITLTADDRNCLRAWTQGPINSNGLDNIVAQLSSFDVKSIIIQYNFGFFNLNGLSQFIDHCLERKIVLAIELHSTVEPPQDILAISLENLAPILKKCHRVLAHSPNDMNRLKAVGVVDNVMLFPLGVFTVDFDPRESNVDRPVDEIASFGFALPGKGLRELIEAVGLLRQEGFNNLRVRMYNSEYPAPASKHEIEACRADIRLWNLEEVIELHTEYLEDSECIHLLNKSTLIVNSYQQTGESASAAVRFALASRTPVLVTPLPIFDELGDAVFRASGTSSRHLADSISNTLRQIRMETGAAKRVQDASARWVEQHDVRRQGHRMVQMLRGLAADQARLQ